MENKESVLNEEHSELLVRLNELAQDSSDQGRLFSRISKLFSGHLDREEETVIPLIEYLVSRLRKDSVEPNHLEKAATEFRIEFQTMINEHNEIGSLLDKVEKLDKPSASALEFVNELRHHVRIEEEIIYPAANGASDLIAGLSPDITK